MSERVQKYLNLAHRLKEHTGLALDETHTQMDHLWELMTVAEQYDANKKLRIIKSEK